MLEQILLELNNWFERETHTGEFSVKNGCLALPFLLDGQHFRVDGSVFNDGLHQFPAYDLIDETFTGSVTALAVPKAVISIAQEAEEWEKKNGEKASGPFQSESFGGYTYTRATNEKGGSITWRDVFGSRLTKWRRL